MDLLPFGPRGVDKNFFNQPSVLGHDLPDQHAIDRATSLALAVADGHHALAHGGVGLDVIAAGFDEG